MSNKERVASLRKRVAKDPYDAAAWEELVSEADRVRRGPERNEAMAAVYEDLLSKFPTAVSAPCRRRRYCPAAAAASASLPWKPGQAVSPLLLHSSTPEVNVGSTQTNTKTPTRTAEIGGCRPVIGGSMLTSR